MPKLTLPYRDLAALVLPVLPFVCTDDALPVLSAVMVEARGRDQVIAYGTDRFRVVATRVTIEKAPKPRTFKALIPAGPLKAALTACVPGKAYAPHLAQVALSTKPIQPGDDRRTVTITGNGYENRHGLQPSFTLAERDGKFPDLLHIVTEANDPSTPCHDGPVGFNPAFLADFEKAAKVMYGNAHRHGATMEVRVRGTGGTGVRIGDQFYGAVMPRRAFPESDTTGPAELHREWLDALGQSVPEAGEKAA